MSITKGRDPVNSGLALHAFRSQGFSPTSAICEIIDNSVEAESNEIRIKFDWREKTIGQHYHRVKEFTFVDNGKGMDKKILYDCLVLGESTRRIGNKGIGKFGVGATFSGISQAKRVQVYSKINGGRWLYTFLDLDSLDQGEGIPEPEDKDPPEEYAKYAKDHGTIVVWDKVDLSDFNDSDVEKLKTDVGRIYRKFLTEKKLMNGKLEDNKPIKIIIQDDEVEPYDPLYITYNPRTIDKEKPTIRFKSIDLKKGNLKSEMIITTSYFPESWWDEDQAGSKPENKKERKISKDNQGVSIVREGREVFFGEIPYFEVNDASGTGTGFVDLDRWTGIEVEFGRGADEIIGVQNNKSRLLISSYAKNKIEEAISSTLVSRRQEIQSKRGKKKSKKGESGASSFGGSKGPIQGGIKKPDYTESDKEVIRRFVEKIATDKTKIDDAYDDLIKGYYAEVSYDLDPTGPFVNFTYVIDSLFVKYNGNHPFIQKFFQTLEELAKKRGEKPENALNIEEIRSIKILFDMLMASLGLSKKRFNLSAKEEVESTINTLITNWGDISYRLSKQKFDSEDN